MLSFVRSGPYASFFFLVVVAVVTLLSIVVPTVHADTTSSWPTLGGSSFRLSQATISLPDPNTGIAITQRISFDSLVLTYPPLVTIDSITILVLHNDTLIFLDSNYEELLSLNVTTVCGNSVTALPVLDNDHASIIFPTARTGTTTTGGGACSLSTSFSTLGQLRWYQTDILVETVVEPLILNSAVWFIGYNGKMVKLDTVTGNRILTSQATLCSTSPSSSALAVTDTVTSPPSQLFPSITTSNRNSNSNGKTSSSSSISFLRKSITSTSLSSSPTGGLLIVTLNGCVTSIDDTTGAPLFTVPNTNLPFISSTLTVNTPPVVDTDRNQAYWLYNEGIICCIDTLNNGTRCKQWSSICVPFTGNSSSNPVNIYTGLAVSPNTLDFHNGRLYCIGSEGTLYAIAADTGTVYASSSNYVSRGVSYTTPLIVPNGWGDRNHGLITVSSSSTDSSAIIGAWEIGNNGQEGDDDPTDDDGQGSTGYVWQLHLPLDTGNIRCPGISVLSDNRLIIITTSGDAIVIGTASNAVEIDDPWVESVIIVGVLILSLSLVGGGYYIAHRQRMSAVSLELETTQENEELLLKKEEMEEGGTTEKNTDQLSLSSQRKSIQ